MTEEEAKNENVRVMAFNILNFLDRYGVNGFVDVIEILRKEQEDYRKAIGRRDLTIGLIERLFKE